MRETFSYGPNGQLEAVKAAGDPEGSWFYSHDVGGNVVAAAAAGAGKRNAVALGYDMGDRVVMLGDREYARQVSCSLRNYRHLFKFSPKRLAKWRI